MEQLNGLFFRRVIGEHARPAMDEHVAWQQRTVDFQRFAGQVNRAPDIEREASAGLPSSYKAKRT